MKRINNQKELLSFFENILVVLIGKSHKSGLRVKKYVITRDLGAFYSKAIEKLL